MTSQEDEITALRDLVKRQQERIIELELKLAAFLEQTVNSCDPQDAPAQQ